MAALEVHYSVRRALHAVQSRWTTLCSDPPPWFLTFCQLYLSSLLLHYGKRWRDPEVTVALLFLILWSAVKSRRIEPFIIAQVLVLTTTIVDYPRIANHAALQMYIALFVIVIAATALVGRRTMPYAHLASGLRGTAVVLYFFVGFHKLNTGFLDPATSCANWYHAKLFQSALNYTGQIRDVLPEIVYQWSPWFVVGAELLVFAFLLIKRTRLVALCVALPIHLYVSLSGFVDFSSMMHSILFLFLPVGVVCLPTVRRALNGYRIAAVGIALVTYYMITHWSSTIGTIRTVQGTVYDVSVLVAAAVICIAIMRCRSGASVESHDRDGLLNTSSNRVRWWYAAFPAVIFAWGALPYAGLSTYGSLTMFSNLVTAPDYDNHLLVDPRMTDLFGFQNDLVQVIDMERELARNFRHSPIGDLVTRSEVANQVTRTTRDSDEPLMAFLLEDGEPTFYEDLRDSQYAGWPYWTRWLFFRKIDPVGEARCRW